MARFLLSPLVFTACLAAVMWHPEEAARRLPALWSVDGAAVMRDALPLLPRSQLESFRLGRLAERLEAAEAAGNRTAAGEALREAAALSGRPSVTAEALRAVERRVAELDARRGPLQRAIGLFSFVNLVWLVAIAGIAAFILPALGVLAQPVLRALLTLAREVVIPFIRAMRHVWEALAYVALLLVVTQGLRMPPETGYYVSLTGVALALPSYAYSVALYATGGGNKYAFAQVSSALFGAWCALVAPHYQSTLLAFLAVSAFFSLLGFGGSAHGLCYFVGFSSADALVRCQAASLVLVTSFTALRLAAAAPPAALGLFAGPVGVYGSVVYFLAGLISSSKFYRHDRDYWRAQAQMIVSLAMAALAGPMAGLYGVFNTACTFGVLYGVEKTLELKALWSHGSAPVTLLACFSALYGASMFLASHPGWIASLFDLQA